MAGGETSLTAKTRRGSNFLQISIFVLFRSIDSWTLESKSLQPVVSRFQFFLGTLATALAYSKAAHLERQHRDLAYSEDWLENIHFQLQKNAKKLLEGIYKIALVVSDEGRHGLCFICASTAIMECLTK